MSLGHQVVIGTSIGIAIAPADGTEPDQLLRNADMALYRAKGEGRGTYHFFQPEMDAQMQARRSARTRSAQGAGGGRVRALLPAAGRPRERQDQRLRGAGALEPSGARPRRPGRFHSGGRGNRPDRADRRMGAQAGVPDAATWPGKLTVAVNLSAVQFRNPTLALSVVSALAASGLAADAARAGDHRDRAAAGRSRGARRAAPDSRARRAHLDGRFRHRLFLAQLSAQLPLRQDQDRPLVHQGARQGRTIASRSSAPSPGSAAASA